MTGAEWYGSGDIPFIRTSDISNWEVSAKPTNGVCEEVYEKYRETQALQPHDILLVVDGRYKIGRSAILQAENCRSVVQSHFRIVTVREGCPLDSYSLLYVLGLPAVVEQMRNLVFIQSTLGSIGKRIGLLELPVPAETQNWQNTIRRFRASIEGRGKLLQQLREFQLGEAEL